MSPLALRDVIRDLASCYNPERLVGDDSYELYALSAPVFQPDGDVAFSLSMWGPPGELAGSQIAHRAARLLDTTASATSAIERSRALAPVTHGAGTS